MYKVPQYNGMVIIKQTNTHTSNQQNEEEEEEKTTMKKKSNLKYKSSTILIVNTKEFPFCCIKF